MSHDGLFNGFISNIIVLANLKSTFSFLADLDVFCFKPNFLATKTTKHIHKKKRIFSRRHQKVIRNNLEFKYCCVLQFMLTECSSHSRMSLFYKMYNLRVLFLRIFQNFDSLNTFAIHWRQQKSASFSFISPMIFLINDTLSRY